MNQRGSLTRQVDAWTVMTVQASCHLARLYRRLRDDKQAAVAFEIMAPSEERARRLGIPIAQQDTPFDRGGEIEAEGLAWERLLEAQAGFCSFLALMDAPNGQKRLAERGYQKALRGLRTAFPEAMANEWQSRAIANVARLCADLFLQDLGEDGTPTDRQSLHTSIQESIRAGMAQIPLEYHPSVGAWQPFTETSLGSPPR